MTGSGPSPRPPDMVRGLLARVLPRGPRGREVLADLDSEFKEQVEGGNIAKARRWYRWEALKVAGHFGLERLRSIPSGGIDPQPAGRIGPMERLVRNLRLAGRSLARQPGFTIVAVLTMAMGIGANAAIFSVVDAVILEPLPYRGPDRLVALFEWNQPRDVRANVANPGNFRDWRERAGSFSGMSAVSLQMPATVTASGEPREAIVQYAHPDFFWVMGLEPALGRAFLADSDEAREGEVLLSHRYWQQRFGGDPEVLGTTLRINDDLGEIVGVLPAGYVAYGEGTELWISMNVLRGDQETSGRWLWVLGRLKEDVSFQQAQAELDLIAEGLQEEHPDFNAGWWINPVPLKEQVVGDVRGILWVLMGAVGLLLLIATANVANLMLVRATERQKEMAILTSLGATGRTLIGRLLAEGLLVAGLGATSGIGLAYLATGFLAHRIPQAFAVPRLASATVDGTVLIVTILATVLTGVLFGLTPALQAIRVSPASTLNAESRGPSRRTGRLRNGLVVAEVALSVVLLGGAALLARSLATLLEVDPGFRPDHVMVGRINLSGPAYESDQAKVNFYEEFLQRLAREPGVEAAGGITFLPMEGMGAGTSYYPMDRPVPDPDDRPTADIRNVAGEYFQAMGIRVLEGRSFDRRDRGDGPRTAVVNQTLAEKQWPGVSAVGKPLYISWETEEPWEIIGVVDDVRLAGLSETPRETIYLSYPRTPYFGFMHIAARASGDPRELASVMREELHGMDPDLPLGSVRPMKEVVLSSAARPRMTAFLMVLFAGLATLLAAIGLYGVLAYAVSRRVREIGVRMAVGAGSREIVEMVVRQGGFLVILGLGLGLIMTLVGGRVLSGLLYQIQPNDPLALAAAALLLLAIALGATALPAWRATRVAPADALRNE